MANVRAKVRPVSTGLSREQLFAIMKTTNAVATESSRMTDKRLLEYMKEHAISN
ncbi:hypothetical protein [Yersinia aldovae]|uniref:hypothetical protein n=1 Tax=Yersinia aldovae TaxID=29483 RepID=UPI00164375B0|nr:hypothetical protein [Yersinia aldovae]